MPTPYKVAIIGAGPAGCTLAQVLRKSGSKAEITIFEGELSIEDRTQGGTLDLHNNTGLRALKEAGLFDEFLKYARYDGEAFRITDKNNYPFLAIAGSTKETASKGTGRPEIDRSRLREILSESLPEGMIRWGRHLESVDVDGTLHTNRGDFSGFDLVVGGDGAWSKVRKVLTDQIPHYAGVGGINLRIADAANRAPWIHRIVNRGSWFGHSDRKAINVQQLGDGSLNMMCWQVGPEENIKSYKMSDPKAVKEKLHSVYRDWSAEFHAAIDAADEDNMVSRNLYMLVPGEFWTNKPGFTLIGDAAHLMTPFAGEGVNVAMEDALLLSQAINRAEKVGTKEALFKEVATFEQEMFKRVVKVQIRTVENMKDMYLNPAAPYATIDKWLIRNGTAEKGFLTSLAIKIVVNLWFTWARLWVKAPKM